jgi:hypothetical protein
LVQASGKFHVRELRRERRNDCAASIAHYGGKYAAYTYGAARAAGANAERDIDTAFAASAPGC